ncbi:peptidase inhibitor family I36 protein [Streptomyces sp. A1136]|uniref:peptidase inhibitor family I36 protein n=1 Tax=Streptomyces sp. A1136 TaxID=2563102 RepID=UPI00109EC3A7|nr:peptidase inhibitor family I36 protein [Streptomyces sp. A1136]THA47086.1 peptidase M23 [Streptomyces sp. A1136]
MRIRHGLAVLAAAVGMTLGAVVPAQADACPSGLFCLYYNSNIQGANANYNWSDSDLAGDTFMPLSGAGAGEPVKNNAASAKNYQVNAYVRVYYNSGYSGPYDQFSPGQSKNLVNTRNENASLYFWL